MQKETSLHETPEDNMNLLKSTHIYVAITVASFFWLGSAKSTAAQDDNTQISELYKLQASYHRAATVQDPANGDAPGTITVLCPLPRAKSWS